jgi:sRNA-binding regulator protein Hfq
VSSQSSTLFTVGTLLRHAQDAATPVRVLVSGVWLDGVIVGADGLGVILDDGHGQQVLVRLDSITAVSFSRSAIDGDEEPSARAEDEQGARAHWAAPRKPIEAGPVSR